MFNDYSEELVKEYLGLLIVPIPLNTALDFNLRHVSRGNRDISVHWIQTVKWCLFVWYLYQLERVLC